MENDVARQCRASSRSSCDTDRTEPPPDASVGQILDAIFRRERSGLVSYLSRQVDREQATDIVQEVFLRAATSSQITNLENPRGFLYCIARNILIDSARQKQRRIVTLPLSAGIDARCAAEQEYALDVMDLEASLERALDGLPEKTRRVFVMHRFQDKPYREIHDELNISVATVEYHMMKALSHLRATLEPAS